MAIHVPRLFVKAPPTETDWIAAALRASQRQVLTVVARRRSRRGNPDNSNQNAFSMTGLPQPYRLRNDRLQLDCTLFT